MRYVKATLQPDDVAARQFLSRSQLAVIVTTATTTIPGETAGLNPDELRALVGIRA